MTKKTFTPMYFKFDPEIHRAIKQLAEKQGKTMTALISDMVKNSAKRQNCWQ